MKNSMIFSVVVLMALSLFSCSTIMQAPELEIISISPPTMTTASTLNITFRNMNNIDAIITGQKVVLKGANTQTITATLAFYVQAKTDAIMAVTFTDIAALRTAVGTDANGKRTMTVSFSGTDAYGYEKTFSVREFIIDF